MVPHTSVKRDGVVFTTCRIIGLAVEAAHKLAKAKSWGSVKPELLQSVRIACKKGKTEVWDGTSHFSDLGVYFVVYLAAISGHGVMQDSK